LQLTNNANTILQAGGTFVDGGQRLQVYGDAFVKGSGNTSATTGLQVQNSDGTNILNVRNDGAVQIGSQSTTQRPYLAGYTAYNEFSVAQTALGIVTQFGAGLRPDPGILFKNSSNFTFTSNTANYLVLLTNYSPTSGTGVLNNFVVQPTINQTGGANGITRGIHIQPTLTAAADWRSIEWSNNSGWGLYGAGTANNYLAGSLGVGTAIPGAKLHALLSGNASFGPTGNVACFQNSSSGSNAYIGLFASFSAEAGIIFTDESQAYKGKIGYSNNTEHMYFQTDGSERARFTSAGRLLLGTTTESTFLLDVNGTARVSGQVTGDSFLPTSSTIPTNGMYLPSANTLGFATNSAIRATLDASGNLGLGVTPSAWWSGVNVFELPNGVSFFGNTSVSGSSITTNAFFNTSTTWIYKTSAQATKYDQYQGQHQWYNAASGTAGNAISFSQVMTLTNNGYLLVGTTTDNGNRLQVSGNGYFSGNVGIGTASPLTLIHIEGTNPVFTLKATNGSTDQKIIYLQNSSGAFNFSKANDAYNTFTTLMQLTNGGNLGIATTSPTAALDTPASTTARATMRIRSGVAPTSPNDGDIWFDGTDLKMRIGGVTKTFTLI
jgi:hypothetical protein